MTEQKIEKLNITDLNLWTENPREPVDINSTDFDIISRAIKDERSKWDLQGLINKMGKFYDFSELPTVVKIENKYIVYDGNRRIAVLKYLQNRDLYTQLNGGLFFNEESKELRELIEIPCNVCNLETALTNIERKHVNSGSWTSLDRDYFQTKHLLKGKSLFILIDEQTGIISNNEKLGQRFIKDEVLTQSNLEDLGFKIDNERGIISNYNKETNKEIFDAIVELVNNKVIQTQGEYRGQLKKAILDKYPNIKDKLKVYNPKEETSRLELSEISKDTNISKKVSVRKTQKTKPNDILFGKTLTLKMGKVNDLYRAICNIYDTNSNDATILPILGMTMRLITEVGARLYFEGKNPDLAKKDQLYNEFLKQAKKEMSLKQEDTNFLSLTNEWLSGDENLEGILAKYAHGNIPVNKDSIIKHSIIIGEILEFYFKK